MNQKDHLFRKITLLSRFQISLEKLDRPTQELEDALIETLTQIRDDGNNSIDINFNVQKGFQV